MADNSPPKVQTRQVVIECVEAGDLAVPLHNSE